jgi:K+/H+ antiporter YhaU regulatory subunit KhtT
MILAMREPDGDFLGNPSSTSVVHAGQVLIAIGTDDQLTALGALAGTDTALSDR